MSKDYRLPQSTADENLRSNLKTGYDVLCKTFNRSFNRKDTVQFMIGGDQPALRL